MTPADTTTTPGVQRSAVDWLGDKRVRLCALVALFVVLFWPVLRQLVRRYEEEGGDYSYGYFIPIVSLFYIYMNWARLKK